MKALVEKPRRYLQSLLILGIFLFLASTFSVFLGSSSLNWQAALSQEQSPDYQILFYSRLPRVLLGILVGFGLSTGGVAFQSLLRNPLADPYILGVSGGAALGSVIAVLFGLPFTWVSISAFLASLLTLLLLYGVAQTKGRLPISSLLLTGVVFNTFCFALIMFVNSLASFEQAHRIWYLIVGSLESEAYSKIFMVALGVVLGFGILFFHAPAMNLMALGEESAQSLGVDVERLRRRIFVAASLMIGAVVSLSGLIGFVGLLIPHLVRLVLGPDHRLLLPASGLFRAGFMVLADWMARTLLSSPSYQTQIPVGVVTALLGGPFLMYLLKRRNKKDF